MDMLAFLAGSGAAGTDPVRVSAAHGMCSLDARQGPGRSIHREEQREDQRAREARSTRPVTGLVNR
ncbi:hypothetical protein GCM10028784_17840 [Myceligenerans cantabricum]